MSSDSRESRQSFFTGTLGPLAIKLRCRCLGTRCSPVTLLALAQVFGLEEPLLMLQETAQISCQEVLEGKPFKMAKRSLKDPAVNTNGG